MSFYILEYIIFINIFLFANPMQNQNLVLKIEYSERSDKQTTLKEINITFVNKSRPHENREENSRKNKVKTSQNVSSKSNEDTENKQEKTLRIPPTQFPEPSEIISKQFKTIREDLEATQDKQTQNVSKTNNIENTLRTIDDYSNVNTKQDISDPAKMDMVPIIQDRGDVNRIKDNLEAFSLNRKETFVATPKFTFPRPNVYETHTYSKVNNYLNIKHYNEMKIPSMKISPVPKLRQTNFQNNRFIREVPKFQRFSDKSTVHKIPSGYFSKAKINNGKENEHNDNKDNEFEKTQISTTTENDKRKNGSTKNSINRNSYRIILNRNAINRSNREGGFPKYYDKGNNLNYDSHSYLSFYKKDNMNANENDNLNSNCCTNQNYNNFEHQNYVQRGANFATPKYYGEKFNNRDQNNFIERHGYNYNNYYRIKHDYNDVSYHNYEKRSINSANPKYYNKQNNQLNDRHIFNDNNGLNQNDNNVEYFQFHDINREINEKKQILDVLHKQNKLIERIAHRLLRDRTIKPEEITWTDFDDIVNSLEARQNRTTSTKLATETTTKTSTIITLVDETEIREALKKDPLVKRILKMVNKRNGEKDNKLKGSIVVHNS